MRAAPEVSREAPVTRNNSKNARVIALDLSPSGALVSAGAHARSYCGVNQLDSSKRSLTSTDGASR